MKTLVLFRLAEGMYATCSLDNLAEFPRKGHTYLLNDRVYEVLNVVEPLASGSGNEQMVKLINLDTASTESISAAVASMTSLDEDTPRLQLVDSEPERVILVRLKARVQKAKVRLGELVIDVQALLSQVPGPDDETA